MANNNEQSSTVNLNDTVDKLDSLTKYHLEELRATQDPERNLFGIDIEIEQLKYGKANYSNFW